MDGSYIGSCNIFNTLNKVVDGGPSVNTLEAYTATSACER
jgi:hypothetical protein